MGLQFAHTLDLVLSGRKSATRRPAKEGQRAHVDDAGEIVAVRSGQHTLWRVGQTYAVLPGRGQPAVGRIRLLAIERATLGDMTDADARAEGVADLAAFRELWTKVHGRWQPAQVVWVLRFELVPAGRDPPAGRLEAAHNGA